MGFSPATQALYSRRSRVLLANIGAPGQLGPGVARVDLQDGGAPRGVAKQVVVIELLLQALAEAALLPRRIMAGKHFVISSRMG